MLTRSCFVTDPCNLVWSVCMYDIPATVCYDFMWAAQRILRCPNTEVSFDKRHFYPRWHIYINFERAPIYSYLLLARMRGS